MKTGDRVKLVSMKEIEEAAKGKSPGVMTDSFGNCWLDVLDVKLGDIGILGPGTADGLFICKFECCTVYVNEVMVELLPEEHSFTSRGFKNFLEMQDTKNQRILVREASVDDKDGGKYVHVFCDTDGPPFPYLRLA